MSPHLLSFLFRPQAFYMQMSPSLLTHCCGELGREKLEASGSGVKPESWMVGRYYLL